MKKVYFYLVLCSVACILVSCAVSIPLTKFENEPYINESDFMSQNFKVVKTVSRTTTKTYVLGIGGFKERHVNPVEELYEAANLNERQQVVNVSTNSFVNVFLCGIVVVKKTTAQGTVIEYVSTTQESTSTTLAEDTISSNRSPQYEESAGPIKESNESIEELSRKKENKLYIAYLFKNRNLNMDYIDDLMRLFDYDEIEYLSAHNSIRNLMNESSAHDKIFEKFAK